MRAAHVIGGAPRVAVGRRRGPGRLVKLTALLASSSLDPQLATGVESWRSPRHAARALQLTHTRRRWAAAKSLEGLVESAERQTPSGRTTVIPPCREQVRDALGEIMSISARLRDSAPIGARGVAALRGLLTDGNGPCYVRSHPAALTDALREVSRWLDVAN
jgi:hypothetical protein